MEFNNIRNFCEMMEQQTEIEEFRFIGAITSSIIDKIESHPLWDETLSPVVNKTYDALMQEIDPLLSKDSLSQDEIDYVVKAYYRLVIDVMTSYIE